MSSFPTEAEIIRVHGRLTKLLNRPEGLRDQTMLRAILLGVRICRSKCGPRTDEFYRAASLLHQVISLRPFRGANDATALGAALLYLSRNDHDLSFGKGQAASLVEGTIDGTMGPDRIASLFRLMAGTAPPCAPTSPRTAETRA